MSGLSSPICASAIPARERDAPNLGACSWPGHLSRRSEVSAWMAAATAAAAAAAGSFRAKPEWSPFFRDALAAEDYVDCSLASPAPAWADAAAGAAEDDDEGSAKPLWLALRHPGGACYTRASLDTFERLDDKLVLAKALAAAGLTDLAPPQLTFEHDDSYEAIVERIQANPPAALGAVKDGEGPVWVLKWAQGFGGQDIHFVRSPSEAAAIITAAFEQNEAMREAMPGMGAWVPGMEDSSEQQPGWVLQSMVPSVLLRGRKIHLRTYVVALRSNSQPRGEPGLLNSELQFFAYRRHEVRLAAAQMSDDLTDSSAHLTTGVWRRGGVVDDRTTLDAAPELHHLEPAVMQLLNKLFLSLPFSCEERGPARDEGDRAFGMSGIDLMVTEDGRIFVLELNASPAAAPVETIAEEHRQHCSSFAQSLLQLVRSDAPETIDGWVRVGVASI
jgi:hypothetical protein